MEICKVEPYTLRLEKTASNVFLSNLQSRWNWGSIYCPKEGWFFNELIYFWLI
jgi:hypothetical protein